MKISTVKTAIQVGTFALNDGTSKARLKLNYENISKDVLKDKMVAVRSAEEEVRVVFAPRGPDQRQPVTLHPT